MQPRTPKRWRRRRRDITTTNKNHQITTTAETPASPSTRHHITTANKNHQITTTTETLASPTTGHPLLPFDLIKEILCRLPVKFLMQFQCVCKSWKSLISNDYKFAKKHLHISLNCPRQSRHHLIIQNSRDSPIASFFNAVSDAIIAQKKLRYPPILDVGFSRAVGSCHGIVCFSIPHFIVYWNPSIGKFKISPPIQKGSGISSIEYGFGYDHSNDNYKMVSIPVYHDGKTHVNVHTLGTNCWRRIQEFPFGVPIGDELGKIVGGTLNWVARENPKKVNSPLFVVSLDMGNESYQEILQPDYGEVKLIGLTLGEFRDCLCIFAHGMSTVDVWIMKEYGNKDSWNKLFTIPHIEDLGRPGVNMSSCIKVAFIYEDEQVLLVSRSYFKPKFVVYDSRSDSFKILKIEKMNGRDPTIYVESLITTCY